jgi:hypothetical protein
MELAAQVRQLLSESRRLHMQAAILRNPARGKDGNRPAPNRAASKELLVKASALRTEAHELDPKHEADAWAQGPDHEQTLAFYRQQGVIE